MALSILWTAISYLTPNFSEGFLTGRQSYFFGIYQGMLLFHGVSASVATLLASISMLVKRGESIHRLFGKLYLALVLFLAAPTGFYLSFFVIGGWTSTAAFTGLSVLWWVSTYLGTRGRNHGYWMRMSYLLTWAAFFLRMMIIVAAELGMDSVLSYQWIAWLCWLPGILLYSGIQARKGSRWSLKK